MQSETLTIEKSSDNALIRVWLLCVCGLIFLMVLVGGATRLTESGLSITEWKPVLGAIPPLSEAHWLEEFEKYKKIPEYQIVNKGMSLSDFKTIYWWEWGHRLLGRLIGLAFFIPFVFFLIRRRLSSALAVKLSILFILGGLQGALGWYMVKSGLTERVDVSQYRLAAHLGLAIFILGAIYWVALGLKPQDETRAKTKTQPAPIAKILIYSAAGLLIAIFLQIILGAFVAGLRAGFSHNTWPLMDGKFIPDGLFSLSPWYKNFFENVLTVQFDHRMLAYVIAIWAVLHIRLVAVKIGEGRALVTAALLLMTIAAQIGLGIWTLLAQVPISLGVIHQGGAAIVFLCAIAHMHALRQEQ